MNLKFLRKKELLKDTGYTKSTLQNRIKDGLWPPPFNLGGRAVAFLESETQAVMGALVEGKSTTDIKAIVSDLVERRKSVAEMVRGVAQ